MLWSPTPCDAVNTPTHTHARTFLLHMSAASHVKWHLTRCATFQMCMCRSPLEADLAAWYLHEVCLLGFFPIFVFFFNIWSIKVKLRLLCLTAHTRPLYSAKLKLNRLSMSRGVTVAAVLRKTDFISCEIKTAGNELQLSGWIAASPGKLGVSANHKIQLSYSYVTQRPLT